jgi:hypothetical protein
LFGVDRVQAGFSGWETRHVPQKFHRRPLQTMPQAAVPGRAARDGMRHLFAQGVAFASGLLMLFGQLDHLLL